MFIYANMGSSPCSAPEELYNITIKGYTYMNRGVLLYNLIHIAVKVDVLSEVCTE